MRAALRYALLAVVGLALGATSANADDAAAAAAPGYHYYAAGEVQGANAAQTAPGLLLMGGGDWVAPAFRWFAEQAGRGHIVILRASGEGELAQDFTDTAGPVRSIETLVFHSREAASDPRVLAVVRHADGIFLGGGDQSNYVRYWQGTPLNAALDAHVRAGRPIGGTSAGLAILGAYSYGAMDGDSLQSAKALRDPLGPGVTLVRNFLHLPYLQDVITDSHFTIRGRLGRLVVFIARLAHEEHNSAIMGLGIDEQAALCLDAQGIGHVYSNDGGYAWLLRPRRQADEIVAGKPLRFRRVPITGIGAGSVLDLRRQRVDKPAFVGFATADNGALSVSAGVPTAVPPAATPAEAPAATP